MPASAATYLGHVAVAAAAFGASTLWHTTTGTEASAGACAAPVAVTAVTAATAAAPASVPTRAPAAVFEPRRDASLPPPAATTHTASRPARAREPETPPDPIDADKLPSSSVEAQEAQRARTEARFTSFVGEALDPAWAAAATASVQQALGAAGGQTALPVRSLQCRSQTCRVELADTGGAAIDEALPQIASTLATEFRGASATRAGDGADDTLVLYLER